MPHIAVPTTSGGQARVVRYLDPASKLGADAKPLFAIWRGDVPVVWANIWLRDHAHLTEKTRVTRATHLLEFVRFLDRIGADFSDVRHRNPAHGSTVRRFRNELAARYAHDELAHDTVRHYLDAAFLCCRWWVQLGETPIGHEQIVKSRGAVQHASVVKVRRTSDWTVPADRGRLNRQDKEKTLTAADIRAAWAYLRDVRRPVRPEALRARPRPSWSEARRAAYERAARSWHLRHGLYRRDLALWGVMLGAGPRLQEVPLLTVHDVLTHAEVLRRAYRDPEAARRALSPERQALFDEYLWLDFRFREETRHLGRLKSGGRSVYLSWSPDAAKAVRDWQEVRAALMARNGRQHDALFTNASGEPLTAGAIRHLFETLAAFVEEMPARALARTDAEIERELAVVLGEAPARAGDGPRRRRRRAVYPHLARHTFTTLLRNNGVDADIRRIMLGHATLDTQNSYGTMYEEAMIAADGRFEKLTRALAGLE